MEPKSKAAGGAGRTKPARSFTHRSIEALKPEAEPYRIPDARCPGLAVRVSTTGNITFDLAFRIKGGKARRMSLGAFPEKGLEEVRDRAKELTRAGRAGRDLYAEEKAAIAEAEKRVTVARLIESYLKREVDGKLRTAKEIGSRLRRALATKLDIAAEDIKRRDLRELLDEVADRDLPREAEKRRQTLGAMFKWAVNSDIIPADPSAGLKPYDAGTPRERVLSADDIRAFWTFLKKGVIPAPHADVLRLELLVGARCGELAGLRKEEIDRRSWVWTLPAARSKNGKARFTPIVGAARTIIEARLSRASDHLFMSEVATPLTSALVGSTLRNHRKKLAIEHFGTHDLRRTVATGMDELGIAEDTIAAVLGHESAATRHTKTLRRHYLHSDRLERKRHALEAWDAHIDETLRSDGSYQSNVLRLR